MSLTLVVSDTDTECVVRLRLAPNRDLLMHLRAYGDHLKVLQPPDEMKASLRATLERH